MSKYARKGYTGRAQKIDANQPEIVAEFERLGATVAELGKPLDLLVGFSGIDQLVEVKNLDGKRPKLTRQGAFTDDQTVFLKKWKGREPAIATCKEDCAGILKKMSDASRRQAYTFYVHG